MKSETIEYICATVMIVSFMVFILATIYLTS